MTRGDPHQTLRTAGPTSENRVYPDGAAAASLAARVARVSSALVIQPALEGRQPGTFSLRLSLGLASPDCPVLVCGEQRFPGCVGTRGGGAEGHPGLGRAWNLRRGRPRAGRLARGTLKKKKRKKRGGEFTDGCSLSSVGDGSEVKALWGEGTQSQRCSCHPAPPSASPREPRLKGERVLWFFSRGRFKPVGLLSRLILLLVFHWSTMCGFGVERGENACLTWKHCKLSWI